MSIKKQNAARPVVEDGQHRILFVCHGNIFRSAFSHYRLEVLLKERELTGWAVRSSGTRAKPGDPSAPVVVAVARDFGLDMDGHRSRKVCAEDVGWATQIYIMEASMREEILAVHSDAGSKIHLLGALSGDPTAGIEDIGPDPDVEGAVRDRFRRLNVLLPQVIDAV
ncbi:MAG: hypothetical protein O2954_15020 [bacterium]|nr:hypothetical protein [bacterium]